MALSLIISILMSVYFTISLLCWVYPQCIKMFLFPGKDQISKAYCPLQCYQNWLITYPNHLLCLLLKMSHPCVGLLVWFSFWYRFPPNLNVLMSPFFDLLKCHMIYIWSASCQETFDTIKSLLTSLPLLCLPSP